MSKLSELIDETQSHHVTIKRSSGEIWFELSLFWVLLIAIAAPQVLILAGLLYLVDVIEIEYEGRPLTSPPELTEKEPPESADAA